MNKRTDYWSQGELRGLNGVSSPWLYVVRVNSHLRYNLEVIHNFITRLCSLRHRGANGHARFTQQSDCQTYNTLRRVI
jgi:hypothetical protein